MKLYIFLLSLVSLASCKKETNVSKLNNIAINTVVAEKKTKPNSENLKPKELIASKSTEVENENSTATHTVKEVIKTVEEKTISKPKEVTYKTENTFNPTKEKQITTSNKKDAPVISDVNIKLGKTNTSPPNTPLIKEAKKVEVKKTVIPSDEIWRLLLKKHVDARGNVSYENFKKDEKKLDTYLAFLAKNEPSTQKSKKEKLAYYINLYNASTVKLILKNYPTKSIKDIKSPWDIEWVKVGDKELSLGYIEHKILRKMNEPRIHFAINCASFSCPQLFNTLFTASNMEQKLELATKTFINDTSRNKFEEKIYLSRIFKWYKKDFTDDVSLLEYIAKYANKDIDTDGRIVYLDYDWSLNERK